MSRRPFNPNRVKMSAKDEALFEPAGPMTVSQLNAGVALRDVDVAEVRSQLARQGVVLHRQADTPDGLAM